jgi:hypothetical protein
MTKASHYKAPGASKIEFDRANLLGRLWVSSAKIEGLGTLLTYFDRSAILKDGDTTYGIGQMLLEVAEELKTIRSEIESDRSGV